MYLHIGNDLVVKKRGLVCGGNERGWKKERDRESISIHLRSISILSVSLFLLSLSLSIFAYYLPSLSLFLSFSLTLFPSLPLYFPLSLPSLTTVFGWDDILIWSCRRGMFQPDSNQTLKTDQVVDNSLSYCYLYFIHHIWVPTFETHFWMLSCRRAPQFASRNMNAIQLSLHRQWSHHVLTINLA